MMGDNDVLVRGSVAPPVGTGVFTNGQLYFNPCDQVRHVLWSSRLDWAAVPPSNGSGRIAPKHNSGGVMAFADGHAKWLNRLPKNCSAWVPHPAVANMTIPDISNPPQFSCNPAGNAAWCALNL
jgi:prepilin-type processing-associated H-X9-DG protein